MPKIMNPATGRLVNKDSPTGKKILKNRRNHLEGTIKSQKRYSHKKTQIHNTNTRVKKHTKNSNSWIDAVTQARSELDITGFHAIKKGTPLYERAKEIQIGGCLPWDRLCKLRQAMNSKIYTDLKESKLYNKSVGSESNIAKQKQKFKKPVSILGTGVQSTLSRLIELPPETKKRKHLKHALKAKECWIKILSYTSKLKVLKQSAIGKSRETCYEASRLIYQANKKPIDNKFGGNPIAPDALRTDLVETLYKQHDLEQEIQKLEAKLKKRREERKQFQRDHHSEMELISDPTKYKEFEKKNELWLRAVKKLNECKKLRKDEEDQYKKKNKIYKPSRNIYLLDRNRNTAEFPSSWEPTKKKFEPKWEPITGMYRYIPDEDSKNQPWSTLGLLKNNSRFEEDPKFNTHKSTFDAWMNGKKIILEQDRTESSHGKEQRYLRFFDNEWAWRVTKFVTMYDTYKIIWENWFTQEDRTQWNDSKDKYLSVQEWETTATDLDHVRLAAYLDLVNLLHGPNSARQLLSIAINNFWLASIWLQSIDDDKTKKLLGDRFKSNIFYFGEGRISSGKDAEYKSDGLHKQMQEWAYGLPTEYRHNDALEQLERGKIAMNSNLANGHENKKLNPSEIFGEHAEKPKEWFTENSNSMGRYPFIYHEDYKYEHSSPFLRTMLNGRKVTVDTGGIRYWDWYYAPLY